MDDMPGVRRATRRRLAATGAVQARLPRLKEQAQQTAAQRLSEWKDAQVVCWMDNWYWERWTTDSARPCVSQNVTALACLNTGEG